MHPTSSFGLLAILPFVAALPVTPEVEARSPQLLEKPAFFKQDAQFDFQPFALTNLDLGCNRKTPDEKFSCKFQFDWEDPNSVKQNNVSSGTCSATWSWDGVTSESGEDNTYPTQFLRCFEALPSFFEMKFNSFDKAENFTLDLAHRYKDSENFTEPYVHPTTWSRPTLELPVIKKEDTALQLHDDGPASATIVGITD